MESTTASLAVDANVSQLCRMGFGVDAVTAALQQHSGNFTAALDALLVGDTQQTSTDVEHSANGSDDDAAGATARTVATDGRPEGDGHGQSSAMAHAARVHIMSAGFSEEEAVDALRLSGGSASDALNMLLDTKTLCDNEKQAHALMVLGFGSVAATEALAAAGHSFAVAKALLKEEESPRRRQASFSATRSLKPRYDTGSGAARGFDHHDDGGGDDGDDAAATTFNNRRQAGETDVLGFVDDIVAMHSAEEIAAAGPSSELSRFLGAGRMEAASNLTRFLVDFPDDPSAQLLQAVLTGGTENALATLDNLGIDVDQLIACDDEESMKAQLLSSFGQYVRTVEATTAAGAEPPAMYAKPTVQIPPAVQCLRMHTRATPSDVHAAVDWLLGVIDRVHEDPLLREASRDLLATRAFCAALTPAGGNVHGRGGAGASEVGGVGEFERLAEGCARSMVRAGRALERYYNQEQLRELVGAFRPPIVRGAAGTQLGSCGAGACGGEGGGAVVGLRAGAAGAAGAAAGIQRGPATTSIIRQDACIPLPPITAPPMSPPPGPSITAAASSSSSSSSSPSLAGPGDDAFVRTVPRWSSAGSLLQCRGDEITSIHVLRLVASVLDKPFVQRVNNVCGPFLAHPVESNGIKGFSRMYVL